MNDRVRSALVEFSTTFAVVYCATAAVCVNQLATPLGQVTAQSSLTGQQPGLLGIALAYGLIVAALVPVNVLWSGGYANPAIVLMLWVYGRMESRKALSLVVVQLAASLLAAGLVRMSFDNAVLEAARMGTPHLNAQAYPVLRQMTLMTGAGIELILTFFLVLAMFGAARDSAHAGFAAGAVLAVCVLVAYPLTGAALNPARWFGPCCWEGAVTVAGTRGPWIDTVVYVAGPILGSLLGGLVCFTVLAPGKTSRGT